MTFKPFQPKLFGDSKIACDAFSGLRWTSNETGICWRMGGRVGSLTQSVSKMSHF